LKIFKGLSVRLLRPLSLLFIGALLIACSSGGDDDEVTPAAPTATTAPIIDITKDDLGRSVAPPAVATRVVAMSPSIVELMFTVGATPVGRPSSADFPEAAKSVANFGTSYQPSYEEIVAMRPDLIIADAVIHEATIDELAKLGAPVFAIRVTSFEDVTRGLRTVGVLTGKKEAGEREARALETKLSDIRAKIPSTSPSVLVIVGAGPTQVFAAKSDSYVGDVIETLGGRNAVTTEPETFRLPGFSEYSLERIVEKDPDVIIAISPGQPNVTTQALSRSPVWSTLKAVKNGRVHEVDPIVYIQSAGPRVSLILDELSRLLYPTVFASAR
jgi:iron complex transport system substrate-binding protein